MKTIRKSFTHKLQIIKLTAKGVQNIKFYAVLFLIIFIGIFSFSSAFSSLMNSIVIRSTGEILSRAYARSGSAKDIQVAVDAVAVAGGGTVYVPAGDFDFDSYPKVFDNKPVGVLIPGGVDVIGAGKRQTTLRQTQTPPTSAIMFFVDGRNQKPTRISGFTFIGNVSSEDVNNRAVFMYGCKDFRVDHCEFIDFCHSSIYTSIYTVAIGGQYDWNRGVIDHCDIDNPYKDVIGGSWAYGISILGPGRPNAWIENISDLLGDYGAEAYTPEAIQHRWIVYIEDCTFKRCRHAIASNCEAFYVVRHCNFSEPRPQNFPMIDLHGAMGADYWGSRGAEVYDNIIDGQNYYGACAIDFRGGGGVVFNNTILHCTYGVRLSYEGEGTNQKCWVNDLWIWSNTFENVTTQIHDMYGIYQEEVNYFLRERPEYTSYPYPHPFTFG